MKEYLIKPFGTARRVISVFVHNEICHFKNNIMMALQD